MTGHGIETVSGMPTTGSLGSTFGAITDAMSFSSSIMAPAMSVSDPRLVNPLSFANSISDNMPSAEERVTTQLRIRTIDVDQKTSNIQLQKGDWLFVKSDSKDTQLQNMLVLLTRNNNPAPSMLDETQREGVNLAQLNKILLLDQLRKLSTRAEPWTLQPGEYFVGQKQLKSAYHVYSTMEYKLAGLIHADGTEAGFAPHSYTSGQPGAFTPIDNNYIFDVVHKGHGYTKNFFGPHLGCGSRLFFVLMPIGMKNWRQYNFRDALAYDHGVRHVEFDKAGAPVYGGRDRTKLFNATTGVGPYEKQRWEETSPGFGERIGSMQLSALIPNDIVIYQMVPYGAASTTRMPPLDDILLPDRKAEPDAVILPIARMRHGYTMPSYLFEDRINSGMSKDTPRLRAQRAQNYEVQRDCKTIECLVTQTIQPFFVGQSPDCHDD